MEDFKKLEGNPAEQAAWLKRFHEFSFTCEPCDELIEECSSRFHDMRTKRPGLFQPQLEALRAKAGAGKSMLEFCEKFFELKVLGRIDR